jgi:hypothetical protein
VVYLIASSPRSSGTFLVISMGIRAGVALGSNGTYERLTYFLRHQKD